MGAQVESFKNTKNGQKTHDTVILRLEEKDTVHGKMKLWLGSDAEGWKEKINGETFPRYVPILDTILSCMEDRNDVNYKKYKINKKINGI